MEEDYRDEDDSGYLILSIGDDGKTNLNKSSDYVRVLEKDFMLIRDFLEKHEDLFNEYLKRKDIFPKKSDIICEFRKYDSIESNGERI